LRHAAGNILRRDRAKRDIDEEIRAHFEMLVDENLGKGLGPAEARRTARLQLGGAEQVREAVLAARAGSLIGTISQDLRYGVRLLARNPGFAFLAVLCLSLGIGVNTSVFSLLDFAYLRPLSVPAADRLAILSRGGDPLFSYPDYADYRDRGQAFSALAATIPTESSLDSGTDSRVIAAEAASANYADALGVRSFLGRWFTDENQPVAVISFYTWQRSFNADPNVLGKQVRSESQWYTIIGVAPAEFTGIYAPMRTDIWVPLRIWTRQYPGIARHMTDRAQTHVMIFGKLGAGVTAVQAAANLNAVDTQVRRDTRSATQARAPLTVELIRGAPNPNGRRSAVAIVTLLFVVVGVVLLIACVNVRNLLLARGAARRRELSIRVALGASRSRLLRQLLTETLILALIGTLGGLVLGSWTNHLLDALLRSLPMDAPIELNLVFDSRVFVFAAAVSLLCTVLCGLLPALKAARVDVFPALKGDTVPVRRSRHLALVAQVGLSLVLLLCAGLFLRSISRLSSTDPGFAVNNRLYALTYISEPEYTPETGRLFYNRTLDHLRALPGVSSAALTRWLPLMVAGQETECVSSDKFSTFRTTMGVIDPGFLATMRVPILEGRDFSPADGPDSPPVILVNQTLAGRLWPRGGAVGSHIRIGCEAPAQAEVIGVVRDTKVRSLGETPQPHFYRPFAQRYTGLATIVIETPSNPAIIAPAIRAALRAESSSLRLYSLESLTLHVQRSYFQVRWEASLILIFGLLALLLSAVGLYGVMASHVTQCAHEIGVRVALGADRSEVLRLILGRGFRITLFGLLCGLAVSAGISRLLGRFLSGLSPTDPITYVGTTLLWVCVALLACYVPARRAMRVDPIVALRHE
jgi:putative ABC transport system permease protein